MPSLNFYFPKCLLRKATVRFIALATWERKYLLQLRSNSDFKSCFQRGSRATPLSTQMSVVISEFMPNSTKNNLPLPQSLGLPCGHEWKSRGSSLRTVPLSPPHPRGRFHEKRCCSFGFCPNEGGEGPAPIFCHLFINAFLVNRRGLFPPKCQYFKLKILNCFKLYTWPKKQIFCLYLRRILNNE